MALRQLVVTLGSGTRTQSTATRTPCVEAWIEAAQGNAADVEMGDKNVTTTVFGRRLPKSTATGTNPGAYIHLGPHPRGAFNLEDIWFAGTADDVVNIIYVRY